MIGASRDSLLADGLSAASSQISTRRRAGRVGPPLLHLVGAPQPGPQQQFDQTDADIAILGGAAGGGKTWALLREPVRHANNPRFGAVIFRRTYPQITNEGGMWDESGRMYGLLGSVPRESSLEWTFPSGAGVKFGHMQHEKDKESWKGAQIPLLCFDQLEDFTESQFFYMLSRNRSTSGVRPYIRATCNPDADSWLATFLAWWIDQETGFPIPERSGVVRWFVRIEGAAIEWADSPEELLERFPEQLPKSVTFIPAKLEDNRVLEEIDPGYRANLMALPFVERMRLLGGNWKVRAAAGLVFDRANFEIVDALPAGCVFVRYWDKAGTTEAENPGAAFSAGVKMGYDPRTKLYYVADSVRGQWSALKREQVIKQCAELDGGSVRIWTEQEPGSGGKESAQNTVRNLAGWVIRAETVTGDKVTRAMPYASQVEAGNVKILRGEWNEAFLTEHHSFPTGKLKDQVDAAAGAFNKLSAPVAVPFAFAG